MDKQLYVERIAADGKKTLEPLAGDARLQVGDILVSRITLSLDRAMDFVQLKDQRAACLEPVNALSGYRYGAAGGYYEEVGDAAVRTRAALPRCNAPMRLSIPLTRQEVRFGWSNHQVYR